MNYLETYTAAVSYTHLDEYKRQLIKYGTEKLMRMIGRMFKKVINGKDLPAEWKEARITSIFKKGNRKDCENYRGISVIATMGRLYGRVLRNKIEENIERKIGEEQACFTARRSCVDQIYTIQQIIEKKNMKNREVHLAFIDLRKAYCYDSTEQSTRLSNVPEGSRCNVCGVRATIRIL